VGVSSHWQQLNAPGTPRSGFVQQVIFHHFWIELFFSTFFPMQNNFSVEGLLVSKCKAENYDWDPTNKLKYFILKIKLSLPNQY
jgi:hypothetical protein